MFIEKMKTKNVILFGFLFFTVANLFGQNWFKISKEIKNKQSTITSSTYALCHFNLRQASNCFEQLRKVKNDTIFLLENENDYSDPSISLTLWNRLDTLTYASNDCFYKNQNGGKNFVKLNEVRFTKYMMKLVSEWDLEKIKKEDKENGGSLPQYRIFATRIILDSKKYKIECIFFRDFFNIKRDGMDFSY